jgi:hypothetical protein
MGVDCGGGMNKDSILSIARRHPSDANGFLVRI